MITASEMEPLGLVLFQLAAERIESKKNTWITNNDILTSEKEKQR
jgi:hypothetical protein